jgi:enoyl-CoA hydratase
MSNMVQSDRFLLEKNNNIGILTIKTSEKINQLCQESLNELSKILEEINNDSSIDVLIFTGHGKAFVAGANIRQMVEMGQQEGEELAKLGQFVFNKIETLNCITIAAINGIAVGGGCELSLACDYRIASEEAQLGQPEISIGAIPGWGGCYRLPRLVGYKNARDMIFTGKFISAQEAKDMGLVDAVVKPEELLNEAKNFTLELLQKSPLILKYAKKALKAGIDLFKDEALMVEHYYFGLSFASEDKLEGMCAFLEKRTPNFKGS